jgi:hypothetical protein
MGDAASHRFRADPALANDTEARTSSGLSQWRALCRFDRSCIGTPSSTLIWQGEAYCSRPQLSTAGNQITKGIGFHACQSGQEIDTETISWVGGFKSYLLCGAVSLCNWSCTSSISLESQGRHRESASEKYEIADHRSESEIRIPEPAALRDHIQAYERGKSQPISNVSLNDYRTIHPERQTIGQTMLLERSPGLVRIRS